MTTQQTATEWARENGAEFAFSCAMDNYEPTRRYVSGRGWFYSQDRANAPGARDAIVLEDALPDFDTRSVFLVDDGRTVRPFYVAGWHDTHQYIMAHAMPTNYADDGKQRLRANDGRPVDYGNWRLGPRTTYHLKVSVVGEHA